MLPTRSSGGSTSLDVIGTAAKPTCAWARRCLESLFAIPEAAHPKYVSAGVEMKYRWVAFEPHLRWPCSQCIFPWMIQQPGHL